MHSEALHLTERFRRLDFGHMEVQLTIDDPVTYAGPFTIKLKQRLLPDADLLESYCAENEMSDNTHVASLHRFQEIAGESRGPPAHSGERIIWKS